MTSFPIQQSSSKTIGARCIYCGWTLNYPNKTSYIKCKYCQRLTRYLNPEAYQKFEREHQQVNNLPTQKCTCGCGKELDRLPSDMWDMGYINGHSSMKDMSNRKCSVCGNTKTGIDKTGPRYPKTDRPHWYGTDDKPICSKCYRLTPNGRASGYRYGHSEKHKIVLQRYRNSLKGKAVSKRWKLEHKDLILAYNRKYSKTEKGKAALKRKNHSYKSKIRQKRYRLKKKLALITKNP